MLRRRKIERRVVWMGSVRRGGEEESHEEQEEEGGEEGTLAGDVPSGVGVVVHLKAQMLEERRGARAGRSEGVV